MRMRRLCVYLIVVLAAGCALYSDVVIGRLIYDPTKIDRGGDLPSMVSKFDLNRAVSLAATIDSTPKKTAEELSALGEAEVMAGRYDDARRHLREAIDAQPSRSANASIAWNLSQLEYMSNNFGPSLDWARVAGAQGIHLRPWLLAYLESLGNARVYQFSGAPAERLRMKMGHPDLPRVEATINGVRSVSAIVDSGAVLSIMSQSLANSLPVRMLGNFEGTFYGLLGEPIAVRFGMIDKLDLGRMSIANVPVAVMPDDKMRFLSSGETEFKIDFLLGAHLLKEFRIELDFRSSGLTFTRVPQSARNPVADQNLFIDQFRPAVSATINRHGWFMFVLDTGSEVTFLNETKLNALPLQLFTPKMHNATLQGLGGSKKHGEKLENVELGVDRWAGTFHTIPMYDADERDRATGIVGQNFLKNFDVVIDFGRMRVDLVPLTDPTAASATAHGAPQVASVHRP